MMEGATPGAGAASAKILLTFLLHANMNFTSFLPVFSFIIMAKEPFH
jgi:hypothetical protein